MSGHDSHFFDSFNTSSIDINTCGLLNGFRCPSPSFSLLAPQDLCSRLFCDIRPFDDLGSPQCESSSVPSLTSAAKRNLRIPFCVPNASHLDARRVSFVDEDDFEQIEDDFEQIDSSLVPSTRNSVSRKAQLFDRHNPLSFNFAVGVDVIPHGSDMEGLVFSESEEDEFNDQPIRDEEDDSTNVVLFFKKVVSGKVRKLAGFTESLYDIRRPAVNSNSSSISSCPANSLLDLEPSLDVASFIPVSIPSSTGRSRISKFQHEVLNTWFYSHLEHPYVKTVFLRLHHQKMSSPCFKVPIGQAEK
jgi:hypothetical protein